MADNKCPQGSRWSVTKNTCLTDADYTAMIQYYIVTGRYDLVNREGGTEGSGFDPLGVNAFFNRISKSIQDSLQKILVIGLGLVLIVVAAYGFVNEGKLKIDLPQIKGLSK